MNLMAWTEYQATRNPKLLNAMVREEMPFVRRVAKHLLKGGSTQASDFDDVVQDLSLGLLQAIDKWIPERGRFETYAFYWLRRSFSLWRRRAQLIRDPRARIEFQDDYHDSVGNSVQRDGYNFGRPELFSVQSTVEDDISRREVSDAIDNLSERDREIIESLYGREDTMRGTATKLNLSKSRIDQLQVQIVGKLKNRMAA